MAEITGPPPSTTQSVPALRPRAIASHRVLGRVRAMTLQQRFLAALLILYIAKAILFVFVFPPFSGHDEVAHFSYIRTVVDQHEVPVLIQRPPQPTAGQYTNRYEFLLPADLYKYCRYTLQWICLPNDPQWADTSVRMATNGESEGVQYAANHPPLYYMIAAPVFWLSEKAGASVVTQLYLLRLLAIPFGVFIVLLAYFTVRTIFPRDVFLLVTVPAFVALQTQISYEATMVNNDIISIASYSWVLYLVIRALRDGFTTRRSALIGFAFGLGVIAKSTSITAAAIIGLAMLTMLSFRSWEALRRSLPRFIGQGIVIAVPTLVMAVPWYIHMWQTYGNFSALPQIRQLQSSWNVPEGSFFHLLFNMNFIKLRFNETWGEWGWRVLPFDPNVMHLIAVPTLVAITGVILYAFGLCRAAGPHDEVAHPRRWQWYALGLMVVACASGYLATIQFGTEFALTQARYYFPVINAIAILLMLGLRTLIPVRWLGVGRGVVIVSLVTLNIFALTAYVIPFYWM